MKKIMFNNHYGLTKAVIDLQKTHTRRLSTFVMHEGNLRGETREVYPEDIYLSGDKWKFKYHGWSFDLPKENYPKYKIGEIVAVAQSYKDIYEADKSYFEVIGYDVEKLKETAGWTNKMFVKADLMPHRVQIEDVWAERLQDIEEDECLKEGIVKMLTNAEYYTYSFFDEKKSVWIDHSTPREAFADLINRTCGKGTWEGNQFVYVNEFKLVK